LAVSTLAKHLADNMFEFFGVIAPEVRLFQFSTRSVCGVI
jgi:hypothetical protein